MVGACMGAQHQPLVVGGVDRCPRSLRPAQSVTFGSHSRVLGIGPVEPCLVAAAAFLALHAASYLGILG